MEESITQPIAKTKSLLYMYSTFFFWNWKGIDTKESSATGCYAKQLFYIPLSFKNWGVYTWRILAQPIAKAKNLLYMYSTFFFEFERV